MAAHHCDTQGVCGAVYMHGIPVKNGFVDMPTPENFSYYIFLLTVLLLGGRPFRDVYIDFGCRFKASQGEGCGG